MGSHTLKLFIIYTYYFINTQLKLNEEKNARTEYRSSIDRFIDLTGVQNKIIKLRGAQG